MESFTPTLLEELTYDARAYGTMLVELWECSLCKKWMIYPPRGESWEHTTFPRFIPIAFQSQVKQAGWVIASSTEVEGHEICSVCLKSGKAYFVCALCQVQRPTSDIQQQFGDPPDFLCGPCYRSTPASQWDAKRSELEEKHRYDFD